jgi:hypothetical protein
VPRRPVGGRRRALPLARRAVLRDTTFVVGGGLVVAMGVAFALGLWWSGAGWIFASAWVGACLTVGFGGFFVYVGMAERRERRRFLAGYDPNQVGEGIPPR